MMAETVKKSRIVSDDDLEESLMQEFNMRLKTCLSSEGLNDEADEEDEEQRVTESTIAHEDNHYENVTIIKSNGNSTTSNGNGMPDLMSAVQHPSLGLDTKNKLDSVEEFIQIERECLSLETSPPIAECNNGNNGSVARTPPDNEEEPEAEAEYKPLQSPLQELEATGISVKDRMLLSTDSASCLLFTQTVTSPMLTPSDERVDFIKDFQEASAETTPPSTVSDDGQNNPIEDNLMMVNGNQENVAAETFEQIETELEVEGDLDPTEPEVDQQDAEIDQPEVDQLMDEMEMEFNDETETEPEAEVEADQVDKAVIKSPDLLRDVPTIQVTVTHQKSESDHEPEPEHEARPPLVESKIHSYEKEVTTTSPRPMSTTPTDLDCKLPSVKSLKDQYIKSATTEAPTSTSPKFEKAEMSQMKSLDIMKQISKFEQISPSNEDSTEVTESSYVETTVVETSMNGDGQVQQKEQVQKKKTKKKSRSHAHEKENISVCDLDSRFYNVNVKSLCRSFGDLTKLPEENHQPEVNNKSKSSFSKFDALQKKNVLHVTDSSKVHDKFNGNQADTSNCKSCGKIVFQMELMKAERSIWHKNCFRCTECNKQLTVDTYQSHEGTLYCKPHFKALFAPKAVEEEPAPTSDKPDLGLEELQSLNVKERFYVFEQQHHEDDHHQLGIERTSSAVNVKRSPSILSKLARFQAKGMDIGVGDESLNGIPIEESSTEDEREEEEEDDEDADLVRAKRAHREKPFHFTGMSDVKNKWEHGDQNGRDERREERKQEIQNIRNRLFMGKQGKMKELYQQAVMDSESGANVKRTETIETSDSTRSIKERFEKGEVDVKVRASAEDEEVFESEISKKSRFIFKELDANATKAPPLVPQQKSASKMDSPEREVYRDPEVTRAEEILSAEDSVVARKQQTAKKMLNKFRQMEEDLSREQVPLGPKPLKRFTPPPEPVRSETESDEEGSESIEEESDGEQDGGGRNIADGDLLEAQKAARAKQLRAKFEKWEANELKREHNHSSVNIIEEFGDEQSQVESTKSLRARFESMKGSQNDEPKIQRPKVNRFV